MGEQIIFYILAAAMVLLSLLAVTSQKIIRSATYLLFVLLGTAGIYLLLNYHFLAMVQIAVYAGGVMVLFIFSILLTNHPGANVKFEKPRRMIVSALAAISGLALCGFILLKNVPKFFPYMEFESIAMQKVGMTLMESGDNGYLLPFEAIGLLILACIIGGIMIARKR